MFTFLPVHMIKKTKVSTFVLKKVLEIKGSGYAAGSCRLKCFLNTPRLRRHKDFKYTYFLHSITSVFPLKDFIVIYPSHHLPK